MSVHVLLCTFLLFYHTAFAVNKTPATILVLGDSLSGSYGIDTDEGWVALLQNKITKQGLDYTVINASVSGDTTRTGLGRIESAVAQHKPAIVIVALGGNDGLRGLAFGEIKGSLARIIESCQQNGANVLLVGVRLPPNYGPAYNEKFAALYRDLSERYSVPLVPRMLDQVAENRALMQPDGIHPTAQAQPRIMQNVWTGLEPILGRAGTGN
ncbi:MAG: arylesterase [Gammaproteobacteria bacterium]|nr:arylesterase [Gammaproteobacteria bacterium]